MATKQDESRALPAPRPPTGRPKETAVDGLDLPGDYEGDPRRDVLRIELGKLPAEIVQALEKLPGERGKTIGFKICAECGEPVLLNVGLARWVGEDGGERVELARHHDCERPHEFPPEGVRVEL